MVSAKRVANVLEVPQNVKVGVELSGSCPASGVCFKYVFLAFKLALEILPLDSPQSQMLRVIIALQQGQFILLGCKLGLLACRFGRLFDGVGRI